METPMVRIHPDNSDGIQSLHPDNSDGIQSHVRVALRVRPFLPQEIEKCGASCVSVLDQSGKDVTVHLKDQMTSRNECYKVDSFFGQEDPIKLVFQNEIRSAIPGIFDGHNATVFAYGATGSGKTCLMQGTENEHGLIHLAMSAILFLSETMQRLVGISYYEIYMDRCYDLLEPKAKEIMVQDDKNGIVRLKGLSSVPVSSIENFNDIYSIGVQRRKVAHTGLNDVSSRSHAVLVIEVKNDIVTGNLNLIDLAGNEDNRKTCNKGIRIQESSNINKSLFALSNVIYALNNNETRIPFRESKLTRILQDSLGGKSRAFMIACLNPCSYQEAVHTVSLAARSRQIVNNFGSVRRIEISNKTVDMEAKLRAWLESKGKTKSIQRMNEPCYPLSKTSKNAESISLTSDERKLFDSEGLISSYAKVASKNQKPESCIDRKMEDHEKMSKRKQKLHDSHQKVISSTKVTTNELFDDNNTFFSVLDSKTPITPFSLASQSSKFETNSSLFDKFKDSLVEKYISFLNDASKEELMLLKGIGQKRAENILELRKSSPTPLKSLSDLEKIGLSAKQVQELIKKGARGIFS